MIFSRPHLLWLLVPFVLFVVALPVANRTEPVVFGLPFFFAWLLGATLLTPVSVWLAWRGDQRYGWDERDERGQRDQAYRSEDGRP
ncbi:DUF3311 domain-containing protein [Streptomyces sp. NPDC002851]